MIELKNFTLYCSTRCEDDIAKGEVHHVKLSIH